MPLSAVKYYQREGLVPAGTRSAPNQVEYDRTHVHRVRLIRALVETGGLSVAATKNVLATLDTEQVPRAEIFRVAQHSMSTPRTGEAAPTADSVARIRRFAEAQGWNITDDNPGIDATARALDGLRAIGFDPPDFYLTAYASAASAAAGADLRALTTASDPDRIAELMVVGTALGDPLFAGLRRLAQQDAAHALFSTDRK